MPVHCQVRLMGRERYDTKFAPRIGPIALAALLYTVFVIFALQGHQVQLFAVISHPLPTS